MLTYNGLLFLSELIFLKFLTLIPNTENICTGFLLLLLNYYKCGGLR